MDSAAVVAGVFVLYLLTARMGLSIQPVHTFATLIWAPAGIALGSFLVFGSRVWPAIAAAAFLANVSIGAPLFVALGIAIGNTLGPALGAIFLKWYVAYSSYHPALPRLRDTAGILLAAPLIPLCTASIGIGSLWLGGAIAAPAIPITWGTWWIGDLLGILIVTPFILKWINRPLFERTRAQQLELGLVTLTAAVTSYIIFWMSPTSSVYYLFIPLTWAALRTGQRGTTLSILIVAAVAITGTLAGRGPFASESLFYLQLFLITFSSISLIFSSAVEERREAFVTLEHRADDLEKALDTIRHEDEAKKEFISVLAHELRNPLATILSSIELIRMRGSAAPENDGLLTTIDERSRAMVRLLDDLLDISRISKKKLTLHKESVALKEFMRNIENVVQPLMKRYGHSFSMHTGTEDLHLRVDPVRFEQILMNLLAYAARYTKTHGTISMLAEREGGMLAIRIRDSGVGIPKGMLERIFEPFFQVNPSRVTNEGLGVGLTLTRELIEMHGGNIQVNSGKNGTASEFTVRLPLPPSPEQVEGLSQVPATPVMRAYEGNPGQVKHTHKILVVDDNEAAADALAELLRMRGHTVTVAYTGTDALVKAMEFDPEAIFLDIGLPDMTGYQVAIKLKEHQRPYFLIALTGYGQDDDKEKAKQAGIRQYLTKPAGLKEIQAALRKMPRTPHEDAAI